MIITENVPTQIEISVETMKWVTIQHLKNAGRLQGRWVEERAGTKHGIVCEKEPRAGYVSVKKVRIATEMDVHFFKVIQHLEKK